MQKQIIKSYMGCVEVSDKIVEKCIDNEENLVIVHKGDRMTLTPAELKSREVKLHNSDTIYVKDGRKYRLVAFRWNPDEIEL